MRRVYARFWNHTTARFSARFLRDCFGRNRNFRRLRAPVQRAPRPLALEDFADTPRQLKDRSQNLGKNVACTIPRGLYPVALRCAGAMAGLTGGSSRYGWRARLEIGTSRPAGSRSTGGHRPPCYRAQTPYPEYPSLKIVEDSKILTTTHIPICIFRIRSPSCV